jgi:hypothetical protein
VIDLLNQVRVELVEVEVRIGLMEGEVEVHIEIVVVVDKMAEGGGRDNFVSNIVEAEDTFVDMEEEVEEEVIDVSDILGKRKMVLHSLTYDKS